MTQRTEKSVELLRRVQVPGKLVLIGEYAVLDGAPAWVAAVDRGVTCEVWEGQGIEVPEDDRFVRAALGWDGRAIGGVAAPHLYRFSDWNPPGLPEKAGFGGSAAAVVAARRASGLDPNAAFAIHHAVQGSGSGIDVFASLHGGVRRFPDGKLLGVPLHLVAVWSGRSAKTGPRVARYQAWAGRGSFVEKSRALVEGFPDNPIACLHDAYALLQDMAVGASLDYDSVEHQKIAAVAKALGGAAKPSGAGGGDVAVALLPDPDRLDAFVAKITELGLPPIPVQVVGPS